MVFRLQNNVPDVYVDQSRDFQLFCRLYDSVFNGVKFSIDSIKRATKTTECDSSLLELLQTKLGLFNSSKVDHDELRCLLAVFPTLMRYKGSRKAIDYVLTLYTHLTNSIVGTYNANFLKEHRLVLTFDAPLRNDTILLEILQYILPTGYTVEYEVADIRGINSSMYVQDKLIYDVAHPINANLSKDQSKQIFTTLATIPNKDTDYTTGAPKYTAGAVGLTVMPDQKEDNK